MTIPWVLRPGPPPDSDGTPEWLGPAERRRLATIRLPKRRADFLLGRLTAKTVALRLLGEETGRDLALGDLDVVAEPSGAPVLRLADGNPLPVGVTISHSDGTAFAAAWKETDDRLAAGVDLERISARPRSLVADFFRPDEIATWGALPTGPERDAFATAVWSAKEAVLKALRVGLAVDTRAVGIRIGWSGTSLPSGLPRPEGDGWRRFGALVAGDVSLGGRRIEGFWRERDGFVLTMAVAGPPRAGERCAA